jgi:hypothetical protein
LEGLLRMITAYIQLNSTCFRSLSYFGRYQSLLAGCLGLLLAGCSPTLRSQHTSLPSSTLPNAQACNPSGIPYGGGSGTTASPFLICSATQLQSISLNLDADFTLASNLDLVGVTWNPIGTFAYPFTGTLNGDGLQIANLVINQASNDYVGLFGAIGGGTVHSLNLNNFQITGQNYVGGLGGSVFNAAHISDVHISGHVASDVTNTLQNTGGLIGYFGGGSATDCSSSAQVDGAWNVGGLVGNLTQSATVFHSHSTSEVTGETQCVGGLIGMLLGSTNGTPGGMVSQSYAVGNVVGTQVSRAGVAGFAGCIVYDLNLISDSYATGNVTYAGQGSAALVGQQYFVSTVSVINTYATGTVSNGAFPGGLIGYCNGDCGVTQSSYWDINTTGQSTSSDSGSTAKTTLAMQTSATYSGWDFVSIWYPPTPGSSYPTLR